MSLMRPQLRRNSTELFTLPDFATFSKCEHSFQLGSSIDSRFTKSVSASGRPIDLTVDAIEVADLVRIEIHTDRQSTGATAKDRIDGAIEFELPLMFGAAVKSANENVRTKRSFVIVVVTMMVMIVMRGTLAIDFHAIDDPLWNGISGDSCSLNADDQWNFARFALS